ncbi:MAG: tRNA pseudouridine(38-40) synthase TruA [Bacteroidetes bacterium]|nr:tRNA pseudouridine(38-40) synthase TruA [Bacteroidota bacterium]
MRYALELAYEGTRYYGWQSQSVGNTVQQAIEEALEKVTRQYLPVMGCGRTDTGVHAKNYFLHFDWDAQPDERFIFRLNNALPRDIAVYRIFPVTDKFHARFSAVSRKYEYHIITQPDPFSRDWAYFRYGELNLEKMDEACQYLLTCRDFKSFSKSRTDVKTYNCDLMECRWEKSSDRLIFHVRADRFLRNMVRAMVGTMLDIGSGKLTLSELPELMQAGDRSNAGTSVPAKGLYLTEVNYPWDKFLRDE